MSKDVCYVCGVEGWSQLLRRCSCGSGLAIHFYCLPGKDEEGAYADIQWVCDCCRPVSTGSETDDCDEDEKAIVLVEEPKPICIIYPEENMELPTGVTLLVNQTGQVTIKHDQSSYDISPGCASFREMIPLRRSQRLKKNNILESRKERRICIY